MKKRLKISNNFCKLLILTIIIIVFSQTALAVIQIYEYDKCNSFSLIKNNETKQFKYKGEEYTIKGVVGKLNLAPSAILYINGNETEKLISRSYQHFDNGIVVTVASIQDQTIAFCFDNYALTELGCVDKDYNEDLKFSLKIREGCISFNDESYDNCDRHGFLKEQVCSNKVCSEMLYDCNILRENDKESYICESGVCIRTFTPTGYDIALKNFKTQKLTIENKDYLNIFLDVTNLGSHMSFPFNISFFVNGVEKILEMKEFIPGEIYTLEEKFPLRANNEVLIDTVDFWHPTADYDLSNNVIKKTVNVDDSCKNPVRITSSEFKTIIANDKYFGINAISIRGGIAFFEINGELTTQMHEKEKYDLVENDDFYIERISQNAAWVCIIEKEPVIDMTLCKNNFIWHILNDTCVKQDRCVVNESITYDSTEQKCLQRLDIERKIKVDVCEDIGCLVDAECIPYKGRTNSDYCNMTGKLKPLLEDETNCTDGYQCFSDYCKKTKEYSVCRERTLIERVLLFISNTFKNLFDKIFKNNVE